MEIQQGSEREEEKGFLLPSGPASYHSTCFSLWLFFFSFFFPLWLLSAGNVVRVLA